MKKLMKLLMVGLFILSAFAMNISVQAESEELIVYTNSLDDEKQAWLEERVEEAGFNVIFVKGGGGEIYERLMAEQNDPQADVAIGMDEGQWTLLKENNLVAPWEPSWIDDIPSELRFGDGYFYPWAEQRIFSFYNPEFVEEANVPNTVEAFGQDENLQGQYIVPNSLGGSTNQKIIFTILLQYLDESGEYGVSDEGWQLVGDYLQNGYMPTEDEDRHVLFAEGTAPYHYYFSGGIPNAEEEYGFTAVPINPEYGVFTMSEQVGVINKGEDHDYTKAQEFAEWWGSEEIQRGWVESFGTFPANANVTDAVDERIIELFELTDRMDVDWDVYNTYLSDWVEKIELELMPI